MGGLDNLFQDLDELAAGTGNAPKEDQAGPDPGEALKGDQAGDELARILADHRWTEQERKILQATKFFRDLQRALVERDLVARGVISAEPPELTEADIAEAGEALAIFHAREEAIQRAIKDRGGHVVKVTAPEWLKEKAKGKDLTLTPDEVFKISEYIAEYILEAAGKGKNAKPPEVTAKQAEKLEYPLDKPNSVIWDLLTETAPNGQITLKFNTTQGGKGKDALIMYSIDFDALEPDLKITKALTPFDKRVYVAAAALYNAGNEIITATQIHKMMGNTTRPGDDALQEINDSLTKMGAARVYIDTDKESRKYPKYARFKYDAALLPFERKTAYINGKLAESAIHLFREPPLVTFAKQRKQVTTIKRALLESPMSKTEENLRIEDYLLERIGRMKNSATKTPRKILYETLFERCRISGKQKQRAPKKVKTYLDHYKAQGWIDGYREEKDGISVILKS